MASTEVKVRMNPREGFQTVITAGKQTLLADEPVSLGGTETGMSPYELLLSSLGACTAMTLKMYIDRKQLPVEAIDVHLTFERIKPEDCEGCTPEEIDGKEQIHHISRLITITGDLTEEQRERLQFIATRCPVHVTLHSHPHVEDALILQKAV